MNKGDFFIYPTILFNLLLTIALIIIIKDTKTYIGGGHILKVKLCIDNENFNSKPTKQDIRKISKKIVDYIYQIDIAELAEQLTLPHGKTFTPCYFKEDDKGNIVRSNINWAGQQIFALDFDGEITHEQFISRCKRFGVIPAFNYSTFSSIYNNKFRAIFVLEHEVTDFRVRNIVQFALQSIFKECDKSCKDGARMFFGGKEILFCEYTATINIPDLLKSLYLSLNTRDSSNASREMKTDETMGSG